MDKISRKGALIDLLALPLAATAVASMASGAVAAMADDSGGTKKMYAYMDKSTHGAAKCSSCALYKAPNACSVVKGKIAPGGWCKLYAKK